MQRYVDVIRDDTGAAVEGAEVRVYQGDTTTLATVYDGAENVVAQPLSTNSSGVIINESTNDDDKIGFKAPAGRYRIEVSKGTASFTLRDVLLGTLSGVDEEILGTAAYADTGTGAANVPTNADLGSAAYEDADAFSSRIASPTPGNLVQQTADGDLEDAGVAVGQIGTPIGGYIYVQTDVTGAEEPDPANHIRLKAGEDGAGDYNEGKLTSESVIGSAPLITATAVIDDSESPMDGQTVHLVETERLFLRAGSPGTLEDDQMQRITGTLVNSGVRWTNISWEGALSEAEHATNYADAPQEGGGTTRELIFDSADSPDARASSTTDGETRPRNIGVAVYMRIK